MRARALCVCISRRMRRRLFCFWAASLPRPPLPLPHHALALPAVADVCMYGSRDPRPHGSPPSKKNDTRTGISRRVLPRRQSQAQTSNNKIKVSDFVE